MHRRTLPLALLTLVARPARAESIEFEVREISRIGSRVMAKGRRDYSLSDIKVHPYERDGQSISEKLLELQDGFKIGARVFFETELSGFGLVAQRNNGDFSWEWFNKVSGARFKKLQGGQGVDVRTQRTPIGEELVEVKFLDDTTLRFKNRGAQDDTHHIIVKAGSVLRFK